MDYPDQDQRDLRARSVDDLFDRIERAHVRDRKAYKTWLQLLKSPDGEAYEAAYAEYIQAARAWATTMGEARRQLRKDLADVPAIRDRIQGGDK